MQKVKVHRYISGKRPEYAVGDSSEEDSDLEDFIDNRKSKSTLQDASATEAKKKDEEEMVDDPRLRRLKAKQIEENREERFVNIWIQKNYINLKLIFFCFFFSPFLRLERHRHIHEPEIIESDVESNKNEEEEYDNELQISNKSKKITLGSDSESDTDLSETEIEKRRQKLRQRMIQQLKEEEVKIKIESKITLYYKNYT